MAYESAIRGAVIVFAILVSLIVFFTMWHGFGAPDIILNTLISAAAGVAVLAVLLVAGKFAVDKFVGNQGSV